MLGGAIAIGIGIGAAIWYAGDEEAPRVASSKISLPPPPQSTPPPPRPPTPLPQRVEIRLDSLPSGRVFAEGRSAELCTTPCAYTIELEDGDTRKRAFVIKADGFEDHRVDVDLTHDQREFRATLVAVAAPPPPVTNEAKPITKPSIGKVPTRPGIKKPAVDKPSGGIDQTELADPFNKKKR
jgi:hypothetical protein